MMSEDTYKQEVEARIDQWLRAKEKAAPTDEGKLLVQRMHALIQRGGKRARPRLLYLTYASYGGTDFGQTVDLGVALELHHQFLLVHDDLIDDDSIRYDGPNIVGYYQQDFSEQKQDIAQAMGLLAGDLLFSFSNEIILQSWALADTQKVELLKLLNGTNTDVAYGQQLDAYNVYPALKSFTTERLALIDVLKSARYSTQLPMQCAASLLGLTSSERVKIDTFAESFGILFQLTDDFSDYFDNSSVFKNRPKYRDYRQGKLTYPLYMGLTMASQSDGAFLEGHLGNKDLSDNVMYKVVSILENCGARKASQDHIESYLTNSHDTLSKLSMPADSKEQFVQLLARYRT